MSRGGRVVALAGAAAAAVCVAVPFFNATTFFGDDHLFLTFARHVRNPLAAFVTDLHGGEYYRPLWMVFWWVLARAGGTVPFAVAALSLHAGAAVLVAAVLRAVGRPSPVAWSAAGLMLLSPQNLAAASWFSASTDLLATDLGLIALWATARRRPAGAAVAVAAACLCKESAYVLPLLSLVIVVARDGRWPRRRELAVAAAQLAVVAAIVVARRLVLHGWGGSGEAAPGTAALLLQIAVGLAKVVTGDQVVPLAIAVGTGAIALGIAVSSAWRRPGGVGRLAPIAFAAVAAAPLLAAGWAVGARYDYLPAVGVCWALAEALAEVGVAAPITVAAVLLLVGVAQSAARRRDVISYGRRLAAAHRAVRAGVAAGHRVFHVEGGIKDLDLALKEDPAIEAAGVLVLDDVPASFVMIPPDLAAAAKPLVAVPPIPPSGAYRFGDVRVVGLVRRGDEPDLSEVLAWFPDLRLFRLMAAPGGRIVARDVSDRIHQLLDESAPAGQD
jgi:hypothetical protein